MAPPLRPDPYGNSPSTPYHHTIAAMRAKSQRMKGREGEGMGDSFREGYMVDGAKARDVARDKVAQDHPV